MNAIVCVKLKEDNQSVTAIPNVIVNNESNDGKLKENVIKSVDAMSNANNEGLSFQNQTESKVKDRSMDKVDSMAIRRRNMEHKPPQIQNQQRNVDYANRSKPMGAIDPDVLAKEIADLLADTDEDDESDSDSDSDSVSDSDSSTDSDSG